MRKLFAYDKSLATVETSQGKLSLFKIFVPLFIEMLLLNTMGTINTLMLSHYSDNAVAAVGAASQLLGMILTFYTIFSTGASIVINHNLGAGNQKNASDAAFASMVSCGVLSLVIGSTLAIFAEEVLSLMHLEPMVMEYAVTYFRIAIQFSFFQAITSSISGIFRSYGKPKISVIVSLSMNLMVALLDYLIIFRPFELPLEGVSGIAIAYVLSEAFGLMLIIIFLIKIPLDLRLKEKNLKTLSVVGSILRVGIPGGFSSISYSLSQVVSTAIIAILGTVAISTKIYVSNIVFYVYVFGLTLGISASLIIGWLVGAGKYDQAYRLNIQCLKLTITTNILFSIVIFIFSDPLLRLFTQDATILTLGKTLMFIDIFVEIGRGFNHIEENSLRGAGDVMFPMAVSIISCWVMSILMAYLLGIKCNLGLAGCWIAFCMDEFFRGITYFFRWRSRKWTSKTITHI